MATPKPLALNGTWSWLGSIIAGAIAPLAFAPYGIWPLGIISLLMLLLCLRQADAPQGFLRGWLYGLGLFGSGTSWVYVSIHVYGNASPALASVLTFIFVAGLSLLFTASFGYCYARFGCKSGRASLVAFVSLWVLFEWLRSWLFTGFPWLLAGYAHTNTWLGHWAPVGGIYLLSLVVAGSAALIYAFVETARQGNWQRAPIYLGSMFAPWLFGALLSTVNWTQPIGQAVTVQLFQPNITQDVKWQPEQRSKTLAALQSNLLQAEPNALLVWPENAIPAFYHQARGFTDPLATQAATKDIGIITGIPYMRNNELGDRIFHNSVIGLGRAAGDYHKQKLVPFGEYVPLQAWLRGLIEFFDLPMSNFRKGPPQQDHLLFTIGPRALKIAPYICYEIVYPDFARQLGHDSDILLTISDDSWFGESIGPFQHLQMAQMRAFENGRYLIRGTNTGISAIVSPQGEVLSKALQFERTSLRGTVKQMSGTTPFGRWGSWPILIICAALFGWTLASVRQYKKSHSP